MRRLLIGLVVVALVLVAVDRIAKLVVENTLASHIEATDSVENVDVGIEGFPFLTQVLANHFDRVDVSMPRLDAQTLAGSIAIEDVRVSLRDVDTADRFTKATATSATGSGFVPYSAFDKFGPIAVVYGGTSADGTDYLNVSAPSLGPAAVQVAPSVADGTRLSLGVLTALSAALPPQLRTFVSAVHDFGGLPSGITVKRMEATEDGLRVTLVGTDVTLAS